MRQRIINDSMDHWLTTITSLKVDDDDFPTLVPSSCPTFHLPGFKELRIQGFEDLRIWGFEDLRINCDQIIFPSTWTTFTALDSPPHLTNRFHKPSMNRCYLQEINNHQMSTLGHQPLSDVIFMRSAIIKCHLSEIYHHQMSSLGHQPSSDLIFKGSTIIKCHRQEVNHHQMSSFGHQPSPDVIFMRSTIIKCHLWEINHHQMLFINQHEMSSVGCLWMSMMAIKIRLMIAWYSEKCIDRDDEN